MADTKISALPASTTPLAGTEVLPIVQGGATVKVSVANLTAGRSFDALGMTLTSTDAGATASPLLELYRDSASPAANDTIGEIEFNGEDSAGNKQAYGLIHGSILSPTSTTEQGQLHFETATAGALTEKMIIGTTNLVINEIGAVFNVRIEGDTDANLFYTDATNSRIGVGTISPAEKLDVVGAIKSSDNIIQGTAAKGFNFTANTPAAGMTSQLLNWYEEGTWTPQYTNTTPPTTPYTMTILSATYTRIGRQVTVRAYIGTSNVNIAGASGELSISGLPFAPASSNAAYSAANVAAVNNWTTYPCFGYVASDSKIYLEKRLLSNGASANMTAADLVAGAAANQNLLMVTATYFV
jgi:hypothetical protein